MSLYKRKCCPAQAIAVGQRAMRGRCPEAVMAELGFGRLRLIDSFPVSMAGARAALRHPADTSLTIALPWDAACAGAAYPYAAQGACTH